MTYKKPDVIKKFISKNKYSRPGTKRSKTTKIAWHYTGQADIPAKNTVSYFTNVVSAGYKVNGKYIYASSHYVVGLDGEIYYIVPEDEIAYTTNSANAYSIGIECTTSGSDDHYPDKEYKAMVKLGAYLADKYNLNPKTDFIRHYDVTKKICPRYFVNNPKKWTQFKQDCYDELHKTSSTTNTKKLENKKSYEFKTKCKVVDVKKWLNVRNSRPVNGKLGEYLFNVPLGEEVSVGYVLDDWAYVEYKNKYGFANIKYLQIV